MHVGVTSSKLEHLEVYRQEKGVDRLLLLQPTGWNFRGARQPIWREQQASEGKLVQVIGLPYSEHSSWPELQDCIAYLRPKRIVPTVNAESPDQAHSLVGRLAANTCLSGDPSRLDAYLVPLASGNMQQGVQQ